jgi:hypothetical protein
VSGAYGLEMARETATAMSHTSEFRADPAAVIHRVVGWAADAHTARRLEKARHWTAVACRLVAKADNPSVARGAVLNGLVGRYGDGLPR